MRPLYRLRIQLFYLKIKVGADAEAEAGDVGVVEVGKAFDQVQANEGKDIAEADTAFDIGLSIEGIGGGDAVGGGELHLRRIEGGVVLAAQAAIEHLGCDDFS